MTDWHGFQLGTNLVLLWRQGGFTNMFEITAHDPQSGNISFENPAQPGFPKGGWQGVSLPDSASQRSLSYHHILHTHTAHPHGLIIAAV